MDVLILILVIVAAVLAALGTAAQMDAAYLKSKQVPSDHREDVRFRPAIKWAVNQARALLKRSIYRKMDRPNIHERESGGLVLRFLAVLVALLAVGVERYPAIDSLISKL